MADWHYVSLIWKGRAPSERELVELNAALHELDYDRPMLLKEGIDTARWRSPLLTLREFLDFLHSMGHPCQGRLTYYSRFDDDGEAWQTHQSEPWQCSTPQVHEKFAYLLKEPRSRFERIDSSDI